MLARERIPRIVMEKLRRRLPLFDGVACGALLPGKLSAVAVFMARDARLRQS